MKNKVTIIGAGMVGSTLAYSLVLKDTTEEIALIDCQQPLAQAQVMDLQHAVPFTGKTIVKVGTYEDCADSAVTVITCGVAQKEGQSRLDLVKKNVEIIRDVIPKIITQNPNSVIVIVTNPVDVLTHVAIKMFPEYKNQIIGSGTMLDSARLRHLLGTQLSIDPHSVHAYIIGEHGDSELPLWSTATIGSVPLGISHTGSDMCERLSTEKKVELFEKARNAAYTIIAGKQATYYGIGAAAEQLVRTILYDKRTVLPVSHLIENRYGIDDVCLSMPVIVGRTGIVGHLCVELNKQEQQQLHASAEALKSVIKDVM